MNNQEAWEDLANAVIMTAVEDLKRELLHLKRHPESEQVKNSVYEAERFFYSDWFDTLTDLDGRRLVRMIKEQIDEKYG